MTPKARTLLYLEGIVFGAALTADLSHLLQAVGHIGQKLRNGLWRLDLKEFIDRFYKKEIGGIPPIALVMAGEMADIRLSVALHT